jgi:hypothetical protein
MKKTAWAVWIIESYGSPTWARTRDLRINSPALYRLSYRGIVSFSVTDDRARIIYKAPRNA